MNDSIKSNVIYRCIGNNLKEGIIACGYMAKPTADRSQYNFMNEFYSCFVLLQGSGTYITTDGTKDSPSKPEIWYSDCRASAIPPRLIQTASGWNFFCPSENPSSKTYVNFISSQSSRFKKPACWNQSRRFFQPDQGT